MDNIPMDNTHFISFLHQNYTDFFTSVYDLQNAADMIGHADLFFKEWTVRDFNMESKRFNRQFSNFLLFRVLGKSASMSMDLLLLFVAFVIPIDK
jgi:hypothetical protein